MDGEEKDLSYFASTLHATGDFRIPLLIRNQSLLKQVLLATQGTWPF